MVELYGGPQEQTRRFFAAASDLEKAQIKWKPLTMPDDQARQAVIYKGNVPLVAGSQVLTTLEPVPLALAGKATAGTLTIAITGGELRSDLPDWGLELPRGSMSLAITYTARYRGDFAGGFAFTGANLGLRLPDGTTVGARADGHSQSVAVLVPGTAVPNLFARFEVPVPAAGQYTLVVRDGTSRASIPFTIAEAGPGG